MHVLYALAPSHTPNWLHKQPNVSFSIMWILKKVCMLWSYLKRKILHLMQCCICWTYFFLVHFSFLLHSIVIFAYFSSYIPPLPNKFAQGLVYQWQHWKVATTPIAATTRSPLLQLTPLQSPSSFNPSCPSLDKYGLPSASLFSTFQQIVILHD